MLCLGPLGSAPPMEIALCMIVRNEREHLPACLAAARGVVDEICIVDTGSTDGTIEVALSFGARVEEHPWADDFSAARNASLGMARSEWILVLDADEVLCDPDRARDLLLAFARRGQGTAGRVLIENTDPAGERSQVAITRFFARGVGVFQGRIHEQLVARPQWGTAAGRSGPPALAYADSGLRVEHGGYAALGAQREAKLARNVALLRSALGETPKDGYLWYQLGRTLAVAEDHQGAVEALEQGLVHCPDGASWAAHLFEIGGYSLRALGHSEQALALLDQVESTFRDRADTCFLIALLAMDCGQLERAESGFERCLGLPDPIDGPLLAESSEAARTYAPAVNLGVMKEVLGQSEPAAAWYRRALEWQPACEPALKGLQRIATATTSS